MTLDHSATAEQPTRWLRVRGARTNSLQGIDVDIPLQRLCVVTGVSGCGKSSLAIDTIGSEGQRRYLEALSVGRRRGFDGPPRPPVDRIEGLPPTVMVSQFADRRDGRGTLATLADVWPLVQALFARAGVLHCPTCQQPVTVHTRRNIVDSVLSYPERTKVLVLAPVVRGVAGDHSDVFPRIARAGYVRVRVDGTVADVTSPPVLDPALPHTLEAVIDRLVVKDGLRPRLEESLEAALTLGQGICMTSAEVEGRWRDQPWQTQLACLPCQRTFTSIEPRTFSWRSPAGACATCHGLGRISATSQDRRRGRGEVCPDCGGLRLSSLARAVHIAGFSATDWAGLTVAEALQLTSTWNADAQAATSVSFSTPERQTVARRVLPELLRRLRCLESIGLDYLALDRSSPSLSNGERQRARLAAALGSHARGILFVLDEPTSGLHARDTARLIGHLRELCRAGNSVLAVEHTPEFIAAADWIIDLGPGAGPQGGRVVAYGTVDAITNSSASATGQFLSEWKTPRFDAIPLRHSVEPSIRPKPSLTLTGCRLNNLKDVTLDIPVGTVTGIAGVSGSGKTTLIFDGLFPAMQHRLGLSAVLDPQSGVLSNADEFTAVVVIDKGLPGRSPIATPATLSSVWIEFRRLFARTREARRSGLTAERFSYRHPDSRCPRCGGKGSTAVTDLSGAAWWETCPECHGRRFHRSIQAATFKGFTVADVLALTIDEARQQFSAIPRIATGLSLLGDLGLGYLPLGQAGTTLSGGELQRLWLGRCLSRGTAGPTLYLLDEPTAGLHPSEIKLLLQALRALASTGHTVVVIEHSLELLRQVDWLVELGPGSGPAGGRIIAHGTPARAAQLSTPTGAVLASTRSRSQAPPGNGVS